MSDKDVIEGKLKQVEGKLQETKGHTDNAVKDALDTDDEDAEIDEAAERTW